MTTRRWLAPMVIVGLLFAGCSSDGDDDGGSIFTEDPGGDGATDSDTDVADDAGDSDGDGDSGSSGDGGDPAAAGGETEGGIPFPAGGLDLLADAGIEIAGQRQLEYPADRADEIIAFFDEWAESTGDEVFEGIASGTRTWQVIGEGSSLATVTVEPDFPASAGGGTVTFVLIVDAFAQTG